MVDDHGGGWIGDAERRLVSEADQMARHVRQKPQPVSRLPLHGPDHSAPDAISWLRSGRDFPHDEVLICEVQLLPAKHRGKEVDTPRDRENRHDHCSMRNALNHNSNERHHHHGHELEVIVVDEVHAEDHSVVSLLAGLQPGRSVLLVDRAGEGGEFA